jgi:4-hydroxy-tetrahydrodipicolinate reductase
MRVAIVGHGRMGREVEAVLLDRGHQPVIAPRGAFPDDCPVGIDFSLPQAVVSNVGRALASGARYVVGTTGWGPQLPEVRALVERLSGGLVHASNFSLGVQLFFRITRHASALLARFPEYDPYVIERHHRLKKDAPSGTAKSLARIVEEQTGRRAQESLDGALPEGFFLVSAVRAGGIIGDHTVGFDSGGDEIALEHRARSRRGFASGAVLAAEWIATRSGFHAFEDVVEERLAGRF